MSAMFPPNCFSCFYSLTLQLAHPIKLTISMGKATAIPQQKGRTWIPSSAVCASIITWNGLDQVLEGSLITRLMTLAQCGGHVVITYVGDRITRKTWRGRGAQRRPYITDSLNPRARQWKKCSSAKFANHSKKETFELMRRCMLLEI